MVVKRPRYQKRHYEDFARLIKYADGRDKDWLVSMLKDWLVSMILDSFRRDNPLFDVEKFYKGIYKEK